MALPSADAAKHTNALGQDTSLSTSVTKANHLLIDDNPDISGMTD